MEYSSQRESISECLSYLRDNGEYYRPFNSVAGKYQKNPAINDQLHNWVHTALRGAYDRSSGFFLKPDRSYTNRNVDVNRIIRDMSGGPASRFSISYATSDIQYTDMFEFLLRERYLYSHRLGEYHIGLAEGAASGPPPVHPLEEYNELLGKLFPGYTFAGGREEFPTNLFVRLPTGSVLPFTDLSSGEQSVFFVLAFFLRYQVENAVIIVDEPELHLHPELARLLVRQMQTIKPGNQLWVATHNGEMLMRQGAIASCG